MGDMDRDPIELRDPGETVEPHALLVEQLSARGLSGTKLTTLLLEVYRRRALRVTPAEVMRRYRDDRFVAAPTIPARDLRRAEDRLIAALPPSAELVALAPLVPLGTHNSVATVDPRKVVATVRGNEVAADPTNALALEAAHRRSLLLAASPRNATRVSLAASQRVVRAQHFHRAGLAAHFQLFGLVTAGRDVGAHGFECAALSEHLRFTADALPGTEILITVLDESYRGAFETVRERLSGTDVAVVEDPERTTGRGYYSGLCFKVHLEGGEVGDGGFTALDGAPARQPQGTPADQRIRRRPPRLRAPGRGAGRSPGTARRAADIRWLPQSRLGQNCRMEPDPELAVLVGLQASGKSTFAASRFASTHFVVSKDLMGSAKHKDRRQRREIAAALSVRRNVVVDNTNPGPEQWSPLIALAHEHDARCVAYFFPPDVEGCLARNAARSESRRVPEVGVFATLGALRRPSLADGFDAVYLVDNDGERFTVVDARRRPR